MFSCKHRNVDEICRVRCAVAEKFIIKKDYGKLFKVYTRCDMAAYLMRCAAT